MNITVTWESITAILAVILAIGAWISNGYRKAIELAAEKMKTESLRAIAELRADSDERYPSKAEWQFLVNELNHMRANCDRRHER